MACFFYCFQLGLTDLKLIYFDAFLDYIMLLFWVLNRCSCLIYFTVG